MSILVPSSAAASPTVARIAELRARVGAEPRDADAQRDLGIALLQRVRETADPSLFAPAEAAFSAAAEVTPDDPLLLVGIAGLQLARHEFPDALATGQRAALLAPRLAAARVVIVDALVELGRYDEADEEAGRMLALGADISTLARVSYLAELRGDLDVAVTAMELAARSPGMAPENAAYIRVQLGNLLTLRGDRAGAAGAYDAALALVPGHAAALAGHARLALADGRTTEAVERFERAAATVPLPEYVIALGDAQAAAGDDAAARRSYDLARAEIALFEAAGVAVDVDLALFEADHGDAARALERARRGHAATPTIRAADAVAWALHRLGRDREALPFAEEALRLGSRDPLLRYHAGAIRAALGDAAGARADLQLALDGDAGFSAVGAADARRILAALP